MDVIHDPVFSSELSADRHLKQFAVNVSGAHFVMHEFLDHVLEAKGRFVNVASASAVAPFPLTGHYGASKCALRGMTLSADCELAHTGVRAISVTPGGIETPMARRFTEMAARQSRFNAQINSYTEGLRKHGDSVLAQPQTPERVAQVIVDEALMAETPLADYLVDFHLLSIVWRTLAHTSLFAPHVAHTLLKKSVGAIF